MTDNRIVRVILREPAHTDFEELNDLVGEQVARGKTNSEEMQLLKSIRTKIELIKQNPMCGDSIPKRLIPEKYNADNLWRIELAHFWRMLYMIKGDKIDLSAEQRMNLFRNILEMNSQANECAAKRNYEEAKYLCDRCSYAVEQLMNSTAPDADLIKKIYDAGSGKNENIPESSLLERACWDLAKYALAVVGRDEEAQEKIKKEYLK